MSPHAEPEIIATKTNSITRERYYGADYQYGFNYINNLGSKLDVLNTNKAQTFFSEYLKKECFDANGEYLVIGVNTSDTYAAVTQDVQIFKILNDGSVNLHTTYSTAIADLQTKSVIPSSSLSETIVYKDAKISAANRIALSARVSYTELIDETLVTTYKNIILILNSSFTVEAAIGKVYDPTSLADSVMGSSLFWQEEDLYYDKQTPSFGDIYSLKYSDLYLIETRVAKFEDTSFMAKYIEGTRVPASYLNFYIANKIVLVPTFKDKNDKLVLKIFKKHFKNRKIIPIDCSILIWGFGAIHCITQQEPM